MSSTYEQQTPMAGTMGVLLSLTNAIRVVALWRSFLPKSHKHKRRPYGANQARSSSIARSFAIIPWELHT